MNRVRNPAVPAFALVVAAAVITSSQLGATPALAQAGRNLMVRHHDLNLARSADVATLERRLTNAARSICRRPAYVSEPVVNHRRCVADAVARANAAMAQLITESRLVVRVGSTELHISR